MRGKEKAQTEWSLVCLSYNLRKIFKLMGACVPKHPTEAAKQHANALLARFSAFFGAISCIVNIRKGSLVFAFQDRRPIAVLSPTGC